MPSLAALNCDTLGLDWTMNPQNIRQIVGKNKALQGNLDPAVLYADHTTIKAETLKMLDAFGTTKHIVNLGHGVYPDTPLDGVKCFVDTVKNYEVRH